MVESTASSNGSTSKNTRAGPGFIKKNLKNPTHVGFIGLFLGELHLSEQQLSVMATVRPAATADEATAPRLAYKTLQALFDANRSNAVQLVLSGDWSRLENPRVPLGMEVFWRQLFETSSIPDRHEAVPIRDTKWNLVKPITVSEIDAMLKGMSNGAAGQDRITLRQLKAIPTALLARMFNLWLAAEALSEQLRKGRTSFIPKALGDLAPPPPEYRPITVSSFITRLIHRCLAKSFSEEISVDLWQKAFVPVGTN